MKAIKVTGLSLCLVLSSGIAIAQDDTKEEKESVRVEIIITDENGEQREVIKEFHKDIRPYHLDNLGGLDVEILKTNPFKHNRGFQPKPKLGVGLDLSGNELKVTTVYEESTAEEAGILEGDVIVEFNEKTVSNIDELRQELKNAEIGELITLKVNREGSIQVMEAELKPMKPKHFEFIEEFAPKTNLPKAYMGFKYDISKENLLVLEVYENSPAEKAGLKRGDLITMIDGELVAEKDLRETLLAKEKGDKISLKVEHGSDTKNIVITLEEAPQDFFGAPGKNVERIRVFLTPKDKEAVAKALKKSVDEINLNSSLHLKTYPNPINNELNIEFPEELAKDAELTISNLNGKIVFEKKLRSSEPIKVDFENEASGAYIIILESDGDMIVKKVIKH